MGHPYDKDIRQPFKGMKDIPILCVCNVNITETYFGMCMLYIPCQFSKDSETTVQCIFWYSVYSIPITVQLYMVQEESDRTRSFENWQSNACDVETLVEAGFSCKDSRSCTAECTSCGLLLNCSSLPGTKLYDYHKRKSPDCEFFKEQIHQGSHRSLLPSTLVKIGTTDQARLKEKANEPEPENTKDYASNAKTKNLYSDRLKTFENPNWPRSEIHQSPKELAEAGFVYTGEKDIVQCHCCGIKLAKWEADVDPWTAHASNTAKCSYLEHQKSQNYINNGATQDPRTGNRIPLPGASGTNELKRCTECPPCMTRKYEDHMIKDVQQTMKQSNTEGHGQHAQVEENRTARHAPQTISLVESCRIKEQMNPMHSAAAESLKFMGYARTAIQMVINEYMERTGRQDFKAVDLMQSIMKMENDHTQFLESDGEDDDDKTELIPQCGSTQQTED